MSKISKIFGPEQSGRRLDLVLSDWFSFLSRTKLQDIIKQGEVKINGKSKKPSYTVKTGDHILMDKPEPDKNDKLLPQDIPLDVIYEDSHLIAIDKPYGLVVHPGPGHPDGTLVNALLGRSINLPNTDDPRRPGIVHRLDKETTGVIVIAKRDSAYKSLTDQFKHRKVQKQYIALATGSFEEDTGTIDAPVGRSERHKTSMKVTMSGKKAVTNFKVIESTQNDSLVYIYPVTGRTHQIRVHFKYIGHPLVNDDRYGEGGNGKLMLHAYKLTVLHPKNGEKITFETDIPTRFESYLSD